MHKTGADLASASLAKFAGGRASVARLTAWMAYRLYLVLMSIYVSLYLDIYIYQTLTDFICMCIYIYFYLFIQIYMYFLICLYTHTYIHTYMDIQTNTYIYTCNYAFIDCRI